MTFLIHSRLRLCISRDNDSGPPGPSRCKGLKTIAVANPSVAIVTFRPTATARHAGVNTHNQPSVSQLLLTSQEAEIDFLH